MCCLNQACRRHAAFWLSVSTLLLVGCASSPRSTPSMAPEVAPEPSLETPNNGSSGWTDRETELLGLQRLLVDRQIFEPYTVEQSLTEGSTVRLGLARALGQIDDRRTLLPLRALLQDPSHEIRRAAAFSLGEQSPSEETQALLLATRDPDLKVGRLAVEALGKWGISVAAVEEALVGLGEVEAWRRLLPSLFRFDESRTVALALQALARPEAELHRWAAFALCRNPRPEGVDAARALLEDPSPEIRGWAARALGRIGESSDLERLRLLLSDSEVLPVIQALRAGSGLVDRLKVAPPESWRVDLRRLVEDPRSGVLVTAIEAAGFWLLDEVLGPRLVDLARAGEGGGETARRRELALGSLVRGDDPHAAELVAEFAVSASPLQRAAASRGAVELNQTEIVESLAGDPVPAVRMALLGAALAGESDADGAHRVRLAFADEDPMVRAVALGWLSERPVVPYEPILVALGHAWNDREPDARLAAVAALEARAESAEDEHDAIVLALLELADHPEFLLRRAVAEALEVLEGKAPPVGAATNRLASAHYQDLVVGMEDHPRVRITTEGGSLELELSCEQAPMTCQNFLQLVGQGFYDGLVFHRVVPGFVVQAGDPRGDGWGGPGYAIRDEINPLRYEQGVLGMALSGPHTGGSQFFITLSPQPHLDGGYTAFGRVVGASDLLDRLEQGTRILKIRRLGGTEPIPITSTRKTPSVQPSSNDDVVSRGRGTH